MPQGASVESVAADPKFRALDAGVQTEVLSRLDPKYAALDADVQKEVLTHLMYGPEAMLRVSQGEARRAQIGEAGTHAGSPIGNVEKSETWGGSESLPQKIAKMSPEQRARLEEGSSMSIPIAMATAPLMPSVATKGLPLAVRALKGAAVGGAVSAGTYAGQNAIHGKFPSPIGTGEAFAVGAVLGAIAEPMLQIPGVRRAIARIPALKKFMPPSKAEEFEAQMEAKAQDLMRRGEEQEALDLKQAVEARRATRAAQQEVKAAKDAAEAEADAAKHKPSPGVVRSMPKYGGRYSPEESAPSYAGKGTRGKLSAPPKPSAQAGAGEGATGASGLRPSASEARITELIRKPVLTPDEAAELERALGPKWKLMRGKGLMQHQAENLGTVRARRAARGMSEPD